METHAQDGGVGADRRHDTRPAGRAGRFSGQGAGGASGGRVGLEAFDVWRASGVAG
jgi:hypothetical protein